MTAKQEIIPVFIPHLGCPHHCVFCNQKRISGSLLPASAEDVVLALETGLPLCARPPELAFYGGSFTAIPMEEQKALLEAAQPFLRAESLSGIRISTRPDAITPHVLSQLKAYGVTTIELGAQSMREHVLAQCGRGHSAEDTAAASKQIQGAGFQLILQMMTGLPGATREDDINTAEQIAALAPDGVRIYPTVVLRDTRLYELWKAEEYREHTVEDAVETCAEILILFKQAGIPVIRLGLNPTEELSGGVAVAGAYHPALGELVRSRVFLKKAETVLRTVKAGTSVTLCVHRRCVSQMIGQHRCNIKALCERFDLRELRVVAGDVLEGEVALLSPDGEKLQ